MTVEQCREYLDGEGRVVVESWLFKPIQAEDTAKTEGMVDQKLSEEDLGAREGLVCSLVAPEWFW